MSYWLIKISRTGSGQVTNHQKTEKTTMKKTIEFNIDSGVSVPRMSPWASPAGTSEFQDLLLKPEFVSMRYKFPLGETRIRIVPALRDSMYGWMLGVHALNYPGGRHSHPRTLAKKSSSVFDAAYRWHKENQPDSLYSRKNKGGYKLLSDPVSVFWMLVEEDAKPLPRLFVASGYDGSRGGVAGLGHQIWQLCQTAVQKGDPAGNPLNPESGTHLIITKQKQAGARYPGYSVRLGDDPAPLDQLTAQMDPADLALIQRLEDVVYIPTEEEEWQLLQKAVDPETVRNIRASVASPRA